MSKTRYDGVQVAFHWLIALLIVAAFGLALYVDDLPLSALKFKLYSYHKWIGISVLALVVLRLVWRAWRGAPSALPGQPAWQVKAAAGIHHLLYLLMLALPLVGWLMSSAKGFPVVLFGVLQLPDLVSRNEALGHQLAEAHEVLAYLLLAVVILHVLAALKHHFIDRDETLRRMLPGRS
ncbi:cytochrome b [Chitiniphilus shinanonensis]|uniref:cytochrome b n=1 Tax=Chitiniphilus shinanonensis TaxID=553088 RepID=UPI003024C2D6